MPAPSTVADVGALERDLRAAVRGEVRFDAKARALYATDASPYRIPPVGVVVPLDEDDVRAAVRVAAAHEVPLLPRGGGTSLAGQTVGEALVIDMSKHLTKVLEVNVEERWARVQPGVVRDQLNRVLAPHGLQFTPDVATTDRANVGGMVANNSSGTHSIKYGKTVDQVISMRVLLADGTELELGPLSREELEAKLAQEDREGRLYREVVRVVRENEDEIRARYPKVMRRVGGYNLDELLGDGPFNLAKLVCGSEGTLALILEVKVALHRLPPKRVLDMRHFDSLEKCLTAVQYINRHGPAAVELLDRDLFQLGKDNPHMAPLTAWVQGDPAAVLLVEFDGETDEELERQLASLAADPEVNALSYASYVARHPAEQRDIVELRRAGLGIYATMKGRQKPTPFIEDAAIPVEKLPYYIPEVIEVCRRHGARTVMYAHASVGVIHVRPLIDLKSEVGVEAFRRISEEVFELVVKYGGSWSGEHGDGLIRSYQNRRLFGDRLYQAFIEVKRAFDPGWRMNPGKVVEAPTLTENLRYGPDYPEPTVATHLDFSDQEGFLGAIEACTGVGACRKVGVGTMCPSYMATRDEDHSTRGRANVLREAITGGLPGGLTSRAVYEVLDLCLECKACKAECPSQVDMAKLKYEWLQHWHDDHGVSLPTLAFANVGRVAPLGQALAPVANALLPTRPVRWLLEKVAGVDARRVLPRYAPERFERWFERRGRAAGGGAEGSGASGSGAGNAAPAGTEPAAAPAGPAPTGTNGRRVALFVDTWTRHNEQGPGKAAVTVLEALGYRVELVPYGCCGRPQLSKGLVRQARRMAEENVRRLERYVGEGVPVLGVEPSCVAMFRDDYPDLVPGRATEAVAENLRMVEEFLAKEWTSGRLKPERSFVRASEPLLFHGHCQQKAVLGTSYAAAVLGWVADDVRVLDAGCCGMAGSFGYAHHDLSLAIGEQRLFPAVREHEGVTAAPGFSCRHQIADGTGKRAVHPVEVLARHLNPAAGQGDAYPPRAGPRP